MNRQQKKNIIEKMQPILNASHIYILDCEKLNANQTHHFRSILHQQQIQCKVLPNALLKILFKDNQHKTLLPILKKSSMLLITQKDPHIPAKILKEFYKTTKDKIPPLKGAFAYHQTFLGANQLKALTQLKSKEQLIGELITLLKSPTSRLLASLQSGQQRITSLLKTLPNP